MMISIMQSIMSPIMRAMFPGGGGAPIPANVIRDRAGDPIRDRAGNYIESRL